MFRDFAPDLCKRAAQKCFIVHRVRTDRNGGAWCPQKQATTEPHEWIQVDLKSVHMITSTETQGRFGNGQGIEYAEAYYIEYWRPRLNTWIRYHNSTGQEVSKFDKYHKYVCVCVVHQRLVQ